MAVSDTIWTWFEGTWHKGNPLVMRAADHGLWLGTPVFDGARYFDGVAPDLDRHCERVNGSALALGMTPTMSVEEMTALSLEGLKNFDEGTAVYIRPMYWTTEGAGGGVILPDENSTVFCLCLEALPLTPADASQTLTRTRFMRPTLASAMTNAKAACLYPNNARMLREAREKGFNNALVTDMLGNVAETATANVFMARDGEVLTPVPNGTFLNGITRQRVISLLREDGVPVREATLGYGDFEAADEVFMTGNISKVTPISAFDETHYQHGPMAKRARSLYWDWAFSA
ncbi:branched-chain amino acid aminotransferase [Rhodobacteraceae bacterium NNCM2]|nr:branched-chain amino acid aminotransferase [Coraliihabitans acroporae]